MSPSHQVAPAVRAHHAKRRPALDVKAYARSAYARSPSDPPIRARQGGNNVGGPETILTTSVTQTKEFVTTLQATEPLGEPTTTTILQPTVVVETVLISQVVSAPSSSTTALASVTSSSLGPTSSPSSPSTSSPTPAATSSSQSSTASPSSSTTTGNPVLENNPVGSSRKSSGIPVGGIAAIVIVLVLAAITLGFFLFRRRQIKGRRAFSAKWPGANIGQPRLDMEKGDSRLSSFVAGPPPLSQSAQVSTTEAGSLVSFLPSPTSPTSPSTSPNVTRKAPPQYLDVVAPPPASYNNPAPPPSPARTTLTALSATRSAVPTGSSEGASALVRVTFVPKLPDELSITPGETIRVDVAYDDGWALCTNRSGDQGMVPLECLEGGGGLYGGLASPGDWRSSKRASSLRSVSFRA